MCPTGALIYNEFGNVYVQQDICNGCANCVVGVPVRRARPQQGGRPGAQVHALLRPAEGRVVPACAKACPTESIKFGKVSELREHAQSAWKNCSARRNGCLSVRRGSPAASTAR